MCECKWDKRTNERTNVEEKRNEEASHQNHQYRKHMLCDQKEKNEEEKNR